MDKAGKAHLLRGLDSGGGLSRIVIRASGQDKGRGGALLIWFRPFEGSREILFALSRRADRRYIQTASDRTLEALHRTAGLCMVSRQKKRKAPALGS